MQVFFLFFSKNFFRASQNVGRMGNERRMRADAERNAYAVKPTSLRKTPFMRLRGSEIQNLRFPVNSANYNASNAAARRRFGVYAFYVAAE